MEHILDNPIWNALVTGNKNISNGNEQARYFNRDAAAFAGLKDNNESNFRSLYELTPLKEPVVLFLPEKMRVPCEWKIILKKELLQMVYQETDLLWAEDHPLVPLQDKDIPAMLELTKITNPGPFLSRTIDFGRYYGVFDNGRLVAMAGERLQPSPYTEISAVCTHPDYTGKGYAAALVGNQVSRIMRESGIPFLHVLPDNLHAYKLYQKLGFQTRREMMVYVLEKQ